MSETTVEQEAITAWLCGLLSGQGVKWANFAVSPALDKSGVSCLRSYYEGRATQCVELLGELENVTMDETSRANARRGAERISEILTGPGGKSEKKP